MLAGAEFVATALNADDEFGNVACARSKQQSAIRGRTTKD